MTSAGVNRSAKTDRVPGIVTPAALTQTISVQLDGLADTSILVRVPRAQDTSNTQPTKLLTKSTTQPPVVACEPVVSVLTDIARQLQPGRCVT